MPDTRTADEPDLLRSATSSVAACFEIDVDPRPAFASLSRDGR